MSSKPALLLLPGMMLDERMWRTQAEALQDIVTPMGADMAAGTSMAEIARAILAKAPASFHLAGFSMGAILGMEIWRQAGARVESVMLMGFSPHADMPERSARRRTQIERALAGELEEMMRKDFVPNYFGSDAKDDRQLFEEVVQMATDLGPDVFRRQATAQIGRADSVPSLETVDVPALVVCGDEDRLVPISDHEIVRDRITNARLEIIKGAGHMLTMEKPAEVTRVMRDFLREHCQHE